MCWKTCYLIKILFVLCALASCGNHDPSKLEKAVERHMQGILYKPETFHPIRYYEPQRMEITKEDAEAAEAINPGTTPFNGWIVAVDMEAIDTNGVKGIQGAKFWLNVACDSVLYSDVALQFRKKGE